MFTPSMNWRGCTAQEAEMFNEIIAGWDAEKRRVRGIGPEYKVKAGELVTDQPWGVEHCSLMINTCAYTLDHDYLVSIGVTPRGRPA